MDILNELLPMMETSSRDLVTYLRDEGCDDVVPEAEALATEISTVKANMVVTDGVIDEESQQQLQALSEKLGDLARKVKGCDDGAELDAFEAGFRDLKERRDAGLVH